MSDIGQNIRKIREFRNLTQEYLATQLGISTRSYGKIESGETDLTLSRLSKIAELLEVRTEQLLALNEKTVFNTFQHQEGQWFVVNNGIFSQEKEHIESILAVVKKEINNLHSEIKTIRDEVSLLKTQVDSNA